MKMLCNDIQMMVHYLINLDPVLLLHLVLADVAIPQPLDPFNNQLVHEQHDVYSSFIPNRLFSSANASSRALNSALASADACCFDG